ncbi:MAG: exodeoxyribonuclease VII large subunit [Candidatus Liptonbacteria bacterium]|nr:exodeoxyribonuclease VII large subunit [Candidatus Liptonbacteria bacterium]
MALFAGENELIQRLTTLRDKLAKQSGQESFKVLQRATIEAIAVQMPRTLEELAKIKGIGPKKLKQFGGEILRVVAGDEIQKKERLGANVSSSDDAVGFNRTNKTNPPSLGYGGHSRTYTTYTTNKTDDSEASEVEERAESTEKILSVSEFLDRINEVLREEDVSVRGEVTGFGLHPSGAFFSLKDKEDNSVMSCYANPQLYRSFGIDLQDGLEVKVGGFGNVYKTKGRLSFLVQSLELIGEGSLQKAYEALKKKLEAEGLFERKRELPEFIHTIGIITSRTGAVISDFRKNLEPLGFHLHLYDVRVEGAQAVPGVVRAVRWFNHNRPDLDILVVMRGGGSLEDLQAFNNELVAREIFASKIPTICAIGHDRDVPIASLVGDNAPSTPTAAAMLVNSSWRRLREDLPALESDLLHAFEAPLSEQQLFVRRAADLMVGTVSRLTTRYRDIQRRVLEQFRMMFRQAKEQVVGAEKYLAAVSPERSLRLGYSIVWNAAGRVVRRAGDVRVGELIQTRLQEGEIKSRVEEKGDNQEI